MPQTYHDIQDNVPRVFGSVDTIQLDLMDGVFVPQRTWPYRKVVHGKLQVESDKIWEQLQLQDRGLPSWEDVDYELDLMVQDADMYLDQWIALGPKRIIFHLESLKDVSKTIQDLQEIRTLIEIGLAIDNTTPVADLFPHLDMIDCVQLMGIARIGFQGEDFDERVLDRIRELKAHAPGTVVQIDGSVNMGTIQRLRDAGAERFVAGSAVWGAGDASEMVKELQNQVL